MISIVTLLGFTSAKGWETTSGCGKSPPTTPGKTVGGKILINDPIMSMSLNRTYEVNLPANYDSSKKYPVIFWFHWWGDDLEY